MVPLGYYHITGSLLASLCFRAYVSLTWFPRGNMKRRRRLNLTRIPRVCTTMCSGRVRTWPGRGCCPAAFPILLRLLLGAVMGGALAPTRYYGDGDMGGRWGLLVGQDTSIVRVGFLFFFFFRRGILFLDVWQVVGFRCGGPRDDDGSLASC